MILKVLILLPVFLELPLIALIHLSHLRVKGKFEIPDLIFSLLQPIPCFSELEISLIKGLPKGVTFSLELSLLLQIDIRAIMSLDLSL